MLASLAASSRCLDKALNLVRSSAAFFSSDAFLSYSAFPSASMASRALSFCLLACFNNSRDSVSAAMLSLIFSSTKVLATASTSSFFPASTLSASSDCSFRNLSAATSSVISFPAASFPSADSFTFLSPLLACCFIGVFSMTSSMKTATFVVPEACFGTGSMAPNTSACFAESASFI